MQTSDQMDRNYCTVRTERSLVLTHIAKRDYFCASVGVNFGLAPENRKRQVEEPEASNNERV
jgi:hypothetical protein